MQAVFDMTAKKARGSKFRDSEFYMSHYQKDADTEKGYDARLTHETGVDMTDAVQTGTHSATALASSSRHRMSRLTWLATTAARKSAHGAR